MGLKKLVRFAAIEKFTNVLQYPKDMKGTWHTFFKNNSEITLELACGKGEYSIGLGIQHPNRNFIGIDVKGNRIYIGAKKALDQNLTNVAFLRTQIIQLQDYFNPAEVSEIWIVFPDPFLREGKAKKRLTAPRFLHIYQKVLKPGGIINLKTDSKELYDYTLETIEQTGCNILTNYQDIYGKGLATGPLAIKTYYEGKHLEEGRLIYYIAFTLPETEIPLPSKTEKIDAVEEDNIEDQIN